MFAFNVDCICFERGKEKTNLQPKFWSQSDSLHKLSPYTKDAFKQTNYKMFGQVGPDR